MLRRVIPFLVFFLIPFLLHAQTWQSIEPGLAYKSIIFNQTKTNSVPYTLHVFKIDPGKFDFKPLLAAPEHYKSIRKMVESSNAVLGVNANFFDENGKPLGLIVSDGRIAHPFKDISWWGVFYFIKNIPHLVHSSQWKMDEKISYAVQAGPRLVVNGKVVSGLKAEQSQKTAIGFNKAGDVFLLTTLYPMEGRELAKMMSKPEAKGGLGCLEALNLDGGSSSQLYAKSGNFELRLPSYVGVPVGLGVFRK